MKLVILAVAVGSLATALYAEPEIKGTPTELTAYLAGLPKVVSIAGESELKIQADRAYVDVKVSTEGRSLQESLSKNAALRQTVADALKKSGIPEQNISGSKFSSRPQYGMFSDKAKSYKIDNTVRVLVADEQQFRTVASAIDAHTDVSYDGVEFEDSKEVDSRKKALAQACEAATQKKQLYEDKLGVKLTAQTFAEGDVAIARPMQMSDGKLYDAVSAPAAKTRGSVYEPEALTSLTQFGEIKYTAYVTVQYIVGAK